MPREFAGWCDQSIVVSPRYSNIPCCSKYYIHLLWQRVFRDLKNLPTYTWHLNIIFTPFENDWYPLAVASISMPILVTVYRVKQKYVSVRYLSGEDRIAEFQVRLNESRRYWWDLYDAPVSSRYASSYLYVSPYDDDDDGDGVPTVHVRRYSSLSTCCCCSCCFLLANSPVSKIYRAWK